MSISSSVAINKIPWCNVLYRAALCNARVVLGVDYKPGFPKIAIAKSNIAQSDALN